MRLHQLFLLLLLASPVLAEDYQCGSDAGCVGRITEDGELREETFRKGDMVSTDAGWSVSTDDGWVKVKTNPRGGRSGGPGRLPRLGWTLGEVYIWTPVSEVFTGTYSTQIPTTRASFLRPVISLSSAPPELCLIGL